MGVAAAMVGVFFETETLVAETVRNTPVAEAVSSSGTFTAVPGMMAHASLEKRLGPLGDIKEVDAAVDMSTGVSRYRFKADTGQIARLTSKLNVARSQMLSAADHGLARSGGDSPWWQPEKEMKCCTRYTGADAKGKGSLFIGYNDNTGIAYIVFTPHEKPQLPLQRR